jgi:transposase
VHETTRSPIAEAALRRIQALSQIEADITGGSAAQRQVQRQARSKPLLQDLTTGMEGQRRRASSKTALGKALQYALGRWDALTRFADDARLAIDNTLAERLLRGIAVTRKNVLFLGSDKGGDRAAILYTLIETAKLNGLNPEAYLAYAIDQLARGHLASRLSELLPWNCKGAVQARTVQ